MQRDREDPSFPTLRALAALGTDRTVTPAEYDFLAGLAAKEGRGQDEAAVRAYISTISAEFLLGSHLDLCEPFDYALLQYRTQAENQDRAMKKLAGQVYYGPDSFTEEGYFEYLHSCLRSDLLTWLVDHRDGDMVEAARSYYEKNEVRFTAIKSVTYQVTQDGVTETRTLEDTMFRTMGQSDPALMDFLERAQPGDSALLPDGTGRTVQKCSITTDLTPFEEQEPYVVELWLNQEALDPLVDAIAANSKLVF